MNAEALIARSLEGKFFNVYGQDVNELRRQAERDRQRRCRVPSESEAHRKRIAAMRQAKQQLMQRRRTGGGFSIRMIIAAVSYAHGVEIADMVGVTRAYPATRARQHAFYLIRTLMNKPFPDIAGHFDRDHSTVMHGVAIWPKHAAEHHREVEIVQQMLGIAAEQEPES